MNTNFENTNGLDDTVSNHVTTARDVAIMSRALIAHPKILEYSSIWMDTIRDGSFGLTNTNRLVRFYPGCTGLKTGSTSKAKFCISATAKRDNMQLIAVIMAAPDSKTRFKDATSLLNQGFGMCSLYKDKVYSDINDLLKENILLQKFPSVTRNNFNEFLKLEDNNKVFKEKSTPDLAIRNDIENL